MRRVRTIRYREIADALRERVVAGEFPAGRLLPSEAALSATYEASRVTIRRALEQLRDEGLVDARQGFGWFVAKAPIRQSLGPPGHAGGSARGVGHPARPADPRLRLRHRGRPDARRCSAPPRCCGCGGSTWPTASRSPSSPSGARPASASTCPAPTWSARRSTSCCRCDWAGPVRPSAPTPPRPTTPACWTSRPGPRCCAASGVTRTEDGEPVLVSVHLFPAYRTEFVVDMPRTEPSIAPTGLRLVE